MDVLDEVLGMIKLDGAMFFHAEFTAPWWTKSASSTDMAPYLTGTKGNVKIFHLVLEGKAFIRLAGGERVPLSAGDIVLLPHGDEHYLGNGSPERPVDSLRVFGTEVQRDLRVVRYGGGGEVTRFVCGFISCTPHQSDPVLAGLPRLVVANLFQQPQSDWLQGAIQSLAGSETAGGPSDVVLHRLAEALFLEVLRRYAIADSSGAKSWLAGSRDRYVGRALKLIHQEPSMPWTLTSLAKEVGISRSRLAERFQNLLGSSPIAYLTQWRHRLAADLLASGEATIAEIADRVGYGSEAGFSRAFSRHFGLPPAQFRKSKSFDRRKSGY